MPLFYHITHQAPALPQNSHSIHIDPHNLAQIFFCYNIPHEGDPMIVQGVIRPKGSLPCGKEVIALRYDEQKRKKHTKKKQRHSFFDRIDKYAAAGYWVVKTVLLLIDWFTR